MDYPKYDIRASEESVTFEFTSIGVKGAINKIVKFEMTDNHSLYNLAFGDKIEIISPDGSIEWQMNTSVRSENGDRDKVLATIVSIIYVYTSVNTDKWIFFAGSDVIKTRLYRMAITKNYMELNKDFHIFGAIIENGEILPVPFNGYTTFVGFITKRKSIL